MPNLQLKTLNPKEKPTPDTRRWLPIARALRDVRPTLHSKEWQQWIRDVLAIASSLEVVLPSMRGVDFRTEVMREREENQ